MFFIGKIQNIKLEFPLLEACLPAYSFVDIDTIMPVCTAVFDTFQPLSCDLLLVVSLHQSDPLSDTFFSDIVVNHKIIKRACLSQQRAL